MIKLELKFSFPVTERFVLVEKLRIAYNIVSTHT